MDQWELLHQRRPRARPERVQTGSGCRLQRQHSGSGIQRSTGRSPRVSWKARRAHPVVGTGTLVEGYVDRHVLLPRCDADGQSLHQAVVDGDGTEHCGIIRADAIEFGHRSMLVSTY